VNPKPYGLSVRLPYSSPEEFLQRYGTNISRGGIYLRSKALKSPGTPVVLEVKMQNGERLLFANTVVTFVTGNKGEGISGMGLKFITLDGPSRRLIEAVGATMPHARSDLPPIPRNVGPIDDRIQEQEEPTDESLVQTQEQPVLPSQSSGVMQVGTNEDLVAPAFVESVLGEKVGPILGIDLGTTNSCAAIVIDGEPKLLRTRDGFGLIPSMIALTPKGQLLIGGPAKAQLVSNPKNVVHGFKRLMGHAAGSEPVKQLSHRYAYSIVPTESGETAVKLGQQTYSLEQLSAYVLREVKGLAEDQLGHEIHRAVITVPAWYTEAQRLKVREAGRLAGLHVERIVNEPTAAALTWAHANKKPQRVLVYDLGGGTFDASVLELLNGSYEVVSTGGDSFLGGIDFDSAVVEWIVDRFNGSRGALFNDRVAVQRVFGAAERAKIALSTQSEYRIHVPFVTVINDKPVDLDVTLTRRELEKLTRSLVDRSMDVCQEILTARGVRADQIDEIVLVGGQSQAPLVTDRITLLFGKRPVMNGNPEEAVALGAALLAKAIEGGKGDILIDVLPKSIGVGLPGGRFHPIVVRNTPLPIERTHQLRTTRDLQDKIELSIFQGESALAKDNTFLGTFVMRDLPLKPKGGISVDLKFSLDAEGLLTLSVLETSTGRTVSSSFATQTTPDEIRKKLAYLAQQPEELAPPPAPKLGPLNWLKRLFS
jgi:molecular chaperone DnaK